jgi:hypothetical protein
MDDFENLMEVMQYDPQAFLKIDYGPDQQQAEEIKKVELLRNTFKKDGFLADCIDSRIKFIFESSQISNIVEEVFAQHRMPAFTQTEIFGKKWVSRITTCATPSMPWATKVYRTLWCLPTCPAAMFYFEGIAKLAMLVLTAYVTTVYYSRGDAGYVANPTTNVVTGKRAVMGTLVMYSSTVVYELGKLLGEVAETSAKSKRLALVRFLFYYYD